jgi:hypothetical protein
MRQNGKSKKLLDPFSSSQNVLSFFSKIIISRQKDSAREEEEEDEGDEGEEVAGAQREIQPFSTAAKNSSSVTTSQGPSFLP